MDTDQINEVVADLVNTIGLETNNSQNWVSRYNGYEGAWLSNYNTYCLSDYLINKIDTHRLAIV